MHCLIEKGSAAASKIAYQKADDIFNGKDAAQPHVNAVARGEGLWCRVSAPDVENDKQDAGSEMQNLQRRLHSGLADHSLELLTNLSLEMPPGTSLCKATSCCIDPKG